MSSQTQYTKNSNQAEIEDYVYVCSSIVYFANTAKACEEVAPQRIKHRTHKQYTSLLQRYLFSDTKAKILRAGYCLFAVQEWGWMIFLNACESAYTFHSLDTI